MLILIYCLILNLKKNEKNVFGLVATVVFSVSAMANNEIVNNDKVVKSDNVGVELINNIDYADSKIDVASNLKIENVENSTVAAGSIKCWAFGKWLANKLEDVSDNQALIDATVAAAVKLCNIADDLGWI